MTRSAARVAESFRVPGDKSITHRALMFASLAGGRSEVTGALTSLDARSTARVLRQLGAGISPLRVGQAVRVNGVERFQPSPRTLNCGNSGTTARLMLGLLAAHPFESTLTGDASLRRRPMGRITEPLERMGARVVAGAGRLPLTLRGGTLVATRWQLPVASAQIKSAILLAAAIGRVPVEIEEPSPSRDHTERMLRRFGFGVEAIGSTIRFTPSGRLTAGDFLVPGDPSSAAFVLVGGLLSGRSECTVTDVGCNPGRIGFVTILRRMGATVTLTDVRELGGEPVGTLTAAAHPLVGTTVTADEVPGLIDEVPMLACLAAHAEGITRFEGVGELRVKESDRLSLLAGNLGSLGVDARIEADDLVVTGSPRPLVGDVVTHHDHRIAMAFQVLGLARGNAITVDHPEAAAVSYPGFDRMLATLAATR